MCRISPSPRTRYSFPFQSTGNHRRAVNDAIAYLFLEYLPTINNAFRSASAAEHAGNSTRRHKQNNNLSDHNHLLISIASVSTIYKSTQFYQLSETDTTPKLPTRICSMQDGDNLAPARCKAR
jgi:hypothetical protein